MLASAAPFLGLRCHNDLLACAQTPPRGGDWFLLGWEGMYLNLKRISVNIFRVCVCVFPFPGGGGIQSLAGGYLYRRHAPAFISGQRIAVRTAVLKRPCVRSGQHCRPYRRPMLTAVSGFGNKTFRLSITWNGFDRACSSVDTWRVTCANCFDCCGHRRPLSLHLFVSFQLSCR